jgi:transcriptional regulator with XRE-family HTH domain
MASLGERVKYERARRRYSQEELARAAKISQALLSRIEAGKVPTPNAGVIKRLARALWVTTDYLLCMDEQDNDVFPVAEALISV